MARITIASLTKQHESAIAAQSTIIKAQAQTIIDLEAKLAELEAKLVGLSFAAPAAPAPAPAAPADNIPPWVDDAPVEETYTVTRERRPVATPTSPVPIGRIYTRRDGATYQKFQVGFNRYVERRVS